jgi:hypothetical protein
VDQRRDSFRAAWGPSRSYRSLLLQRPWPSGGDTKTSPSTSASPVAGSANGCGRKPALRRREKIAPAGIGDQSTSGVGRRCGRKRGPGDTFGSQIGNDGARCQTLRRLPVRQVVRALLDLRAVARGQPPRLHLGRFTRSKQWPGLRGCYPPASATSYARIRLASQEVVEIRGGLSGWKSP